MTNRSMRFAVLCIATLLAAQAFGEITILGVVTPDPIPTDGGDPNARKTDILTIGDEEDGAGTVTIDDAEPYRRLNVSRNLFLIEGAINVLGPGGSHPDTGTLYTPGESPLSSDGGVYLGRVGGPEVTALIDGGYWDAPGEYFLVGNGGPAVVEVDGGGIINRAYLDYYNRRLQMRLGEKDADARGHGTLKLIDGQVIGDVVVGAGGDGVLEVGAGGVLGSAEVETQADVLYVGFGSNANGTATFEEGATINNRDWYIGRFHSTGTVNILGDVNAQADHLRVFLGWEEGTGTLNLHNASLDVYELALTSGVYPTKLSGDTFLNLDNSTLTVHGALTPDGGGRDTTVLENDSVFNLFSPLHASGFGYLSSDAHLTASYSDWYVHGTLDLGMHAGHATVVLNAGAYWDHDKLAAVDSKLITCGGYVGAPGSANITLNDNAQWVVRVPAHISEYGSTVITLNDDSVWDLHSHLVFAPFKPYGEPALSETEVNINGSAVCRWRGNVTKLYGGTVSISINGGTLLIGEGDTPGFLDGGWITEFPSGTIRVQAGGRIYGGPLPALVEGTRVEAGSMSAAHLPEMSGGTLTLDELLVCGWTFWDPWEYVPSGSVPGFTYDHLTLEGGHLVIDALASDWPDYTWDWGHLESLNETVLPRRDWEYMGWPSFTDVYLLDWDDELTLRGPSAFANLTDTGTALLGNPHSVMFSSVWVRDGAELTTAQTDIRYGAEIEVLDDGRWTSEGNVLVAGQMSKSSSVTLAGGKWISRGDVHLGFVGMGMDVGSGWVVIEEGGVWSAENGYALELGQVILNGGTLIYGLNEEGRRLDFDPAEKLASFESGTLVVYGSILGDIELRPDATLSVSRVDGSVINGGMFLPGRSPAASVIEGDYVHHEGAILEMEIYGPTPGTQHDTLEVRGTTTIQGGTLAIRLGDYGPTVGQQFSLFDWTLGPQSESFAAIEFVDREGYTATLDYESGILTIDGAETPIDPDPVRIDALAIDREDEITLTFEGKSGRSYTLEFTPDLMTAEEPPPAGWHGVNTVLSDGTTVSITHTNEAPSAFYRVVSP